MATKQKTWYPQPELRERLRAWPEGEAKRAYWDAGSALAHPNRGTLRRLVVHGYLKEVPIPTVHNGKTFTNLGYERTSKQPPLYKPRPELKGRPSKRTYGGPHPWPSAATHFQAMQGSPARVAASVARKLGVGIDQPKFKVTDEVTVQRLRRMLAAMFSDPTFTLHNWGFETATDGRVWTTNYVANLVRDGRSTRLTLLEMLIEPEYDEAGDFVRFRRLDGEAAKKEWEEITGAPSPGRPTISKREEYERYMEERRLLRERQETVAA